jgi:hypothetical protein
MTWFKFFRILAALVVLVNGLLFLQRPFYFTTRDYWITGSTFVLAVLASYAMWRSPKAQEQADDPLGIKPYLLEEKPMNEISVVESKNDDPLGVRKYLDGNN